MLAFFVCRGCCRSLSGLFACSFYFALNFLKHTILIKFFSILRYTIQGVSPFIRLSSHPSHHICVSTPIPTAQPVFSILSTLSPNGHWCTFCFFGHFLENNYFEVFGVKFLSLRFSNLKKKRFSNFRLSCVSLYHLFVHQNNGLS